MKKNILFLLLSIFTLCTYGQKVGLVLSGGGAKGITHIGIIRALEENGIPIDYITGTSMGAIVGSMYAMGYSPDDMERLLKSPDFKRWYQDGIEEKYMYYFKLNPPTPEFINIKLNKQSKMNKVKTQFLPSSIIPPLHMNIVFLELFAQANALTRNDFDNLMVPFRCIASDVYNKKAMVLGSGDMGDAVRASMSFPGVFKPIEIDSVLAYDGGIYNNFPVNVMVDEFKPDIIIGSTVSSNPDKPVEGDIMSQLENMIMQKTDYTIPDSLGILLSFQYTDINLMDFDKFDKLHDIGYNKTIEMMDSIKSRISRRVDMHEVEQKRDTFKNALPEIVFRKIYVRGVNEQQRSYVTKEFHSDKNDSFSLEDFKKGYFRLLSDNMITEVIPHAVYNYADETFDLHLNVKMDNHLSLRIGGNVGSNSANQIYMGATYHNLSKFAKEFSIDGQLGQIYNNLQLGAKIDLPTNLPTSYRVIGSVSSFDYLQQEKVFNPTHNHVFNKQDEAYLKMFISFPFLNTMKAEFGLGIGALRDQYFQSSIIDFNNDSRDVSKYRIFGGNVALEGNTLNSKQFATSGRRERISAHIYTGKELFKPAESNTNDKEYKYTQSWLKISYEIEKYYKLKNNFTLGAYIQAYYSSRNFSNNYYSTMMQAGEFSPTAHSRISYNEAFRANQFLGLGVCPIYELNPVIHARLGLYGFIPVFPIRRDKNNKAYYGDLFSKYEHISELSVVVKLPFGAISVYTNHYSSPKKEWNFGLTLGWQLFGRKFMD